MTSRTVDHYGVAFMNALNQRRLPKFANGGLVGGTSSGHERFIGGNTPNVTVKVINNGQPMNADVETKQSRNDLEITVKMMEKIADGIYRRNQARDMRSGGVLSR